MSAASSSSRQVVSRASGRSDKLRVRDTSHLLVEETFTLASGGTIDLTFYDPVRLLQHCVDNAPPLAQHFGNVAAELGPQPWNVLLAFDEQTPGSKVNADNKRKSMILVMNFLELGADVLENKETWLVPLCIQSHCIKAVSGGWSAVLRRILRRLFVGTSSLTEGGVLVRYVDGQGVQRRAQIQGQLHSILTDGEGHQLALQWNGPSSMRPTFIFSNVFKLGSGMAGDEFVEISCSDLMQMRMWSTEHLLRVIDDDVLGARDRFTVCQGS